MPRRIPRLNKRPLEVEGQAVAAVVDDQPHQERDPANEVKDVSNDAPSADQVTTDHADVAIVAVNQSVEDSYDSHAPEVVTPEAVENHDSGRRRRDRRDPAASQALAATPNGRLNTDQEFRESAPQVGTGESKVADPELALDPSLQQDVAESSDRLRGRSQGNLDAVQHDPRPVSQATQTRSQERPAATEVPTLIDSSVTAEKQQASAPSQQPVASNVESTITNIQNVAASAIRSGPQNVGHSGSQPTMRTLAIDGTPSEKSLPKPARDSRGKESNTAETLSRVKLIQRVSKAFQHLGPEGGVVRLRLAPAELGSVRVEMRVKHRQVEARVIAESEAASAALREHLPELRQRLESQGMQVERLEIESEQEESSFGRHSGHENRDSENGAEQWKDHRSGERRNTPRTRPSNSQSVSQLPRSPLTHGGVDVQL